MTKERDSPTTKGASSPSAQTAITTKLVGILVTIISQAVDNNSSNSHRSHTLVKFTQRV